MDAFEKKEKGNGWKEEENGAVSKNYNAPPVPPFSTYLTAHNYTNPNVSMVKPAAPTIMSSFQPSGRMSTTKPSQMYTTNPAQNYSHPTGVMAQPVVQTETQSFQPAGRISSPNQPQLYTTNFVPPQAQWTGHGEQMLGPAQGRPHHLQEAHQLPYPGGHAFNQFYQ